MEKLIIVNKTDLPMSAILRKADGVIGMGRISDYGKSYCYVSTFKDGIVCCAQKNKASDTLTFFKEDQE